MATQGITNRGNLHVYAAFVDPATGAFSATAQFSAADRIPEVMTAPFNNSANEVDATSVDSGGYKDTLAGVKSGSMDIEAVYVVADPYLAKIKKAYNNNEPVRIFYVIGQIPAAGAKNDCTLADARILSFDIDPGELVKVKFKITLSGAPVDLGTLTAFPNVI